MTRSTELVDSSMNKNTQCTIYPPESDMSITQYPSTIEKAQESQISDVHASFTHPKYMETTINTPLCLTNTHCKLHDEQDTSYKKKTSDHNTRWQSRLSSKQKGRLLFKATFPMVPSAIFKESLLRARNKDHGPCLLV